MSATERALTMLGRVGVIAVSSWFGIRAVRKVVQAMDEMAEADRDAALLRSMGKGLVAGIVTTSLVLATGEYTDMVIFSGCGRPWRR